MLNTTNYKGGNSYQTTNFNTPCSGLIQKSHPKSTFIRFAKGSEMEKWIFPYDGKTEPHLSSIKIVVLQVMLFGDSQYLCEVLNADTFEKELLTEK